MFSKMWSLEKVPKVEAWAVRPRAGTCWRSCIVWLRVGRVEVQEQRVGAVRFSDAIHNRSPLLCSMQDVLGHPPDVEDSNFAPRLEPPLKGRFDMAKYWNNDQGITSLGVSASISRVVNQSASPLGSTMARGLVSPTGPRAFLGTGSGPGWLLAVAPVPRDPSCSGSGAGSAMKSPGE